MKDKKDQKNRKKKFQKRKKWIDIPATGNNAIDISKKKKKNRNCDISEVTYYNYNKKNHFANTCTKLKN